MTSLAVNLSPGAPRAAFRRRPPATNRPGRARITARRPPLPFQLRIRLETGEQIVVLRRAKLGWCCTEKTGCLEAQAAFEPSNRET
jgi:hypothetical protein